MVTILDMPDHRFRSGGPKPVPVQSATKSGYTGTPQVSANPWHGYFTLSAEHVPIIGEANARPWRAFFGQLNGQANWFRYPAAEGPQSGATFAATVLGAQGLPRSTLRITLAPNVPGFPVPGMFATINNQLLLINAVAAVAGNAAARDLTFNFPLRAAAANGAAIELVSPYGVFMLDDPASPFPEPSAGQIYNFSIAATDVGRVLV